MNILSALEPVPLGKHTLPPLPYGYAELEPVIDEKTLRIHHDDHHKAYVEGLNKAENALAMIRASGNNDYLDYWEDQLAFNGSGHILHSVYWTIMTAPNSGGEPMKETLAMIDSYFGGFDAFKMQFVTASKKVQGSGWGILAYNPAFRRLEILMCEKHQNFTQWGVIPILVCDVWEHAYYLQYNYMRPKFVDDWFSLINWAEVERRLKAAKEGIMRLEEI